MPNKEVSRTSLVEQIKILEDSVEDLKKSIEKMFKGAINDTPNNDTRL